jgi:hypothetical protein
MNKYVKHDRYVFNMFEYFLSDDIEDLSTMNIYYSENDGGIDEILVDILLIHDMMIEPNN